jgi:hypothetical protein
MIFGLVVQFSDSQADAAAQIMTPLSGLTKNLLKKCPVWNRLHKTGGNQSRPAPLTGLIF